MEDQNVLVATLADVRHFVAILRTVAFKPRVRMQMLAAGLCFSTQESHILQAKAYVPVQVFTTFAFNPPPAPRDERAASVDSDGPAAEDELPPSMSIEINLSHLLECLDIFRSSKAAATGPTKKDNDDGFGGGFRGKAPQWDDDDEGDDDEDGGGGGWRKNGKGASAPQKVTSARLEWGGEGEQLRLVMEEQDGGPKTECYLSTSDPEETEMLDFDDERDEDQPALQIILSSEHLKRQLQCLEPSSDRITLSSRAPGIAPHPSATGQSSSSSAFPHSYSNKRTPQGNDSSSRKKRKSKDRGADFMIEASGTFDEMEMVSSDKKPLCIQLDRRVDHIKHQYKKHLLLRSLRALAYSHKSSLSMHESGLFVLQVMMSPPPPSLDPRAMGPAEKEKKKEDDARRKAGDITDGIVEFLMMALSPEDEEREMSGDGSSS